MVNEHDEIREDDIELTNEESEADIELTDEEEQSNDKIKQLRKKLKICDDEKRQILEDSQRAKADFLNAKRRMEEDRKRDKIRYQREYVETLLPLCDSFDMAMSDTAAWEKADENWRKGIEGIHKQLHSILKQHGISEIAGVGQAFDPNHHEAIGHETVADKAQHDTVVNVMQKGYEIVLNDTKELVRPARVIIGEYKE